MHLGIVKILKINYTCVIFAAFGQPYLCGMIICHFIYCREEVKMFLVGLTGGIATGKSTVSNMLKEHGCVIIDSDIIARQG